MAGRFEGVSDAQWELFYEVFPESEKRRLGPGMPRASLRTCLHSLLYILFTGSRWCDLPQGKQWASKSSAHRAVQRWGINGTLLLVFQRLLNIAEAKELIDWTAGSVDGSFSPRKRWRTGGRIRVQR